MYDFEFDARKFRARSALPTAGRKLLEDEFSGAYGTGYNNSLRESVGRSLSIARDVIRESSAEPVSNYYNAYATARRDRLNKIAESSADFDRDIEDYLRTPAKRYYSYNVAPQRDVGRGFWWPYYSYPYTSLMQPYRTGSRIPSSFFDPPSSFGSRRPDPTYVGGYYRPSASAPRKSLYTPRTYEPPTRTSFSSKPFSRYSHYYVPRHYPGTPMVGGYLFPTGGSYGWRY